MAHDAKLNIQRFFAFAKIEVLKQIDATDGDLQDQKMLEAKIKVVLKDLQEGVLEQAREVGKRRKTKKRAEPEAVLVQMIRKAREQQLRGDQ